MEKDKKLFWVEVTYAGYVYAEDAHSAESYAGDIVATETWEHDVSSTEVQSNSHKHWEDGGIVYGDTEDDVYLKEVWPKKEAKS